MGRERETAIGMFERQEEERRQFFVDQAKRLREVDFDWKLPDTFHDLLKYHGKGLFISGSKILSYEGKLITIAPDGYELPHHHIHDYPGIFVEVEERVDETLASFITSSQSQTATP